MAGRRDNQTMTPKAAEYFAMYVNMGPSRSLRALADNLVKQNFYKTSSVALRMLNTWSSEYSWQSRLANAITDLTEERLAKAAEIDAGLFLNTSELLEQRLGYTMPIDLNSVLSIRDAVRRPTPKQSVDVSVKHSGRVDHIVRRVDMSALSDDDLERLTEMAERVAIGEGVG